MNNEFSPKNVLDTYWDGFLRINYQKIFEKMKIIVIETSLQEVSLALINAEVNNLKIYILKLFLAHIFQGLSQKSLLLKKNDLKTESSFQNSND